MASCINMEIIRGFLVPLAPFDFDTFYILNCATNYFMMPIECAYNKAKEHKC
jgi:hypothetical protein